MMLLMIARDVHQTGGVTIRRISIQNQVKMVGAKTAFIWQFTSPNERMRQAEKSQLGYGFMGVHFLGEQGQLFYMTDETGLMKQIWFLLQLITGVNSSLKFVLRFSIINII